MIKDVLEELKRNKEIASTAGPNQQVARNQFYANVWNNWEEIATVLQAVVDVNNAD